MLKHYCSAAVFPQLIDRVVPSAGGSVCFLSLSPRFSPNKELRLSLVDLRGNHPGDQTGESVTVNYTHFPSIDMMTKER